jgi:hypothetical protein
MHLYGSPAPVMPRRREQVKTTQNRKQAVFSWLTAGKKSLHNSRFARNRAATGCRV